jgi:hypothetical protein
MWRRGEKGVNSGNGISQMQTGIAKPAFLRSAQVKSEPDEAVTFLLSDAMFSRSGTSLMRSANRRLLSLLVCLSIMATILPVPVASMPEKDRSQPFPCQDHPCGCRNAEQCWRSCCCFTRSQKLAWARKRGITPPMELLARAEETPMLHHLEDHPESSPSEQRHCRGNCCQTQHSQSRPDHGEAAVKAGSQRRIKLAIGLFAEQCRSGGVHWNSLPWTILPEPFVVDERPALATAAPIELAADPELICERPPVPPPRSACRVCV